MTFRQWWYFNGPTIVGVTPVLVVVLVMVFHLIGRANRTECENLCLVQGYDYAIAEGCNRGADCVCFEHKRAITISEGERQ